MLTPELEALAASRIRAGVCVDCGNFPKAVARSTTFRDIGIMLVCSECVFDPKEEARKARNARAKERRDEAHAGYLYTVPRKDRVGAHDVSKQEYAARLEQQGGVCASCSRRPDDRAFHLDHDHACNPMIACTKCFRGVLCNNCNTGIGMLGDSVENVRRALTYLEAYEATRIERT